MPRMESSGLKVGGPVDYLTFEDVKFNKSLSQGQCGANGDGQTRLLDSVKQAA